MAGVAKTEGEGCHFWGGRRKHMHSLWKQPNICCKHVQGPVSPNVESKRPVTEVFLGIVLFIAQ